MKAQCPECDSWVQVPRSAELWDTIVCPRCHTELQLISENPPEFDYADLEEEESEDLEDFEDFEDDFEDLDDDDEEDDF